MSIIKSPVIMQRYCVYLDTYIEISIKVKFQDFLETYGQGYIIKQNQ